MTNTRSKLQEDTYFRVLRLFQMNPGTSHREPARVAGVSVGAMQNLLSALVDKGLVKFPNFTAAEDKRRYAYVLTPKSIARRSSLTRAFLMRKMAEHEA